MIGGGTCTSAQYEAAYRVAGGLAVMCGGRGGVMEAACKGARDAGGLAVAVGGGTGTANELKLALRFGKTVFGLEGTPEPEGAATIDREMRRRLYRRMRGPDDTVEAVLRHLGI